jgi:hypothetical protein
MEDIDVSNLTPTTIWRIRNWIYGSPHQSLKLLDDFPFLRLLFAACGSAEFCTHKGHIGYEWCSYLGSFAQEVDEVVGGRTGWKLGWLEHRVRVISGTLRPLDRYYEPYDIVKKKGEWGERVPHVEGYQVDENGDDEDEEKEDLTKVPWLVWERKGLGIGSRGGQLGGSELARLLGILGQRP